MYFLICLLQNFQSHFEIKQIINLQKPFQTLTHELNHDALNIVSLL